MYIGKTPTVGNFQVCDAISVVNGQAAYTLQVGGVNVAPESANHMLVSLNGILQKPGSSFTISSSTMTFASNLATGDVIDFVQILGNVLDIGQPSDDTVKTASLQSNAVTSAKMFSGFANGITMADMWRITTDFSGSVQPITANWERCDENTFEKIGSSGMSVSSGIWSFPVTGLYEVVWHCSWTLDSAVSRYVYSELITTNDNSTYTERGVGWGSIFNGSGSTYNSATISVFMNVSNVSNQKLKLGVNVANSSVNTRGSSTANHTHVSFIRLGDSQ
jgi:hypothetical protein